MQRVVRLIKPYSLHGKGELLTLDVGLADTLIQAGRAEAVTPEPTKPEEKINQECRPSKTKKK